MRWLELGSRMCVLARLRALARSMRSGPAHVCSPAARVLTAPPAFCPAPRVLARPTACSPALHGPGQSMIK